MGTEAWRTIIMYASSRVEEGIESTSPAFQASALEHIRTIDLERLCAGFVTHTLALSLMRDLLVSKSKMHCPFPALSIAV